MATNMRMLQGVRACAVFGTVLAGLSACTPAEQPIVAVSRDGGRVRLSVYLCEGESVDLLSVSVASATTGSPGASRSPSAAWAVAGPQGKGIVDVDVFSPGPGWTVSMSDLTVLKPGVRYVVGANTSGPRTGGLSFTLEQLATLRPAQMLVAHNGADGTVMSRAGFAASADDGC